MLTSILYRLFRNPVRSHLRPQGILSNHKGMHACLLLRTSQSKTDDIGIATLVGDYAPRGPRGVRKGIKEQWFVGGVHRAPTSDLYGDYLAAVSYYTDGRT